MDWRTQELATSKKAKMTALGTVVISALNGFGMDPTGDLTVAIASLFGVYVAAQGAADFGQKNYGEYE